MRDNRTVPRILIDSVPGERRLALMDDMGLADLMIERPHHPMIRGAIALARVRHVVPSLGTAFLDLGPAGTGLMNYHGHAPVEGGRMIVQVAMDAHAEKDARVTDKIRLVGRFAVFRPGGKDVTVSQNVRDKQTRHRLAALAPDDFKGGLVIRSRAAEAAPEMVQAEIVRLRQNWAGIQDKARATEAPHLLAPAPGAVARVLIDWAEPGTEIVVDSPALLKETHHAIESYAPDLAARPHLDTDAHLFEREGAEVEIAAALDHHVELSPAGRLSIHETPALVAVDVDSGAAESWAPETTADQVNAAAAPAVVREARRRGLGGTIVVDIIGWEDQYTRAKEALRAALDADPLSSRPTGIGGLGLLVFTRQRLGPTLEERMRGMESRAAALLRRIERQAADRPGRIAVTLHPDLAAFLRAHGLADALAHDLGREMMLTPDPARPATAEGAGVDIGG